jgi:chloride channel protein, CIC family
MLLLLVATGLVCGFAAVAFHWIVDKMRALLIVNALHQHGVLRVVAVIAVPCLVATLISVAFRRFAPSASGANLARVRRAYSQEPGILDAKSVAATAVATPISLGSGAPLGPEGPTVVISSGIAIGIARLVGLPKRVVRGMIPVGTAAGIAAIFNTPITGVVFALEEVMGSASKGVLGGTIVAAVAAAVVERMMLGGRPILSAPSGSWTDVRELAGFLLVGIIAGLVSGSAMRILIRLRAAVQRSVASPALRAAIGGAAVGAIGLFVPSMLSVGYETTGLFLRGGGSFFDASTAFGAKAIAFVLALAFGLVGGTFAPSLFMGSALGATVGHGSLMLFPQANIDPGAYALVGMGAFFSGLLRCPIASVLIVFEVTGDYGLILPLMLAVAVSTSLSRWIQPQSMTELQMREEGWEEARSSDPLHGVTVGDAMSAELVTVKPDERLLDIARAVTVRHRTYPVVDEAGRLLGLLHGDAIAGAVRESRDDRARDRMSPPALVLKPEARLLDVMERMRQAGVTRCPVVNDEQQIVGFLSPSDILRVRLRSAGEDDTLDRHFG